SIRRTTQTFSGKAMSGPRRLPRPCLTVPALALLLWAAAAPPAAAQSTYTWVSPNTGHWSDPLNWVEGAPAPSATTQLVFNATGTQGYTATNDLADPFTLNRLTLTNAGTGTVTVAP